MLRASVIAIVLAMGCGGHKFDPVEAAHVETTALAVGTAVPLGPLTSTSGAPVAFADLTRGHAQTVVVFYRGFY